MNNSLLIGGARSSFFQSLSDSMTVAVGFSPRFVGRGGSRRGATLESCSRAEARFKRRSATPDSCPSLRGLKPTATVNPRSARQAAARAGNTLKCFLFLALALLPLTASAQLQWRLSIKLIADANGNPAPNAAQNYTNEVITANQLLDSYGRGYRFQIAELLTLTGVSQWYGVQARNNSNKLALQAAARTNSSLYAYRNNAINVYVVNDISGVCSFPPGDDIVLVGANAYRTLLLHECGHFFNLRHTHNSEQFENFDGSTCTNADPCTCFRAFEGDDGIADTPLDNQCFTRNQISSVNFDNRPYDLLNDGEKAFVNNTWLNIMSYHPSADLTILTDDQLDFATDASNTSRFNVATGRTRFVDRTHAGAQDGSRANPFRGVGLGIVAATPGDIVLIRPGNYNETATYAKPVTLRATRGAATIGRP